MPAARGEKFFGFAYAKKISVGKDLNIEFDQQAAMEFCMAVLRSGLAMRRRDNSIWVTVRWNSQKKTEHVDVAVHGYEKPE